MATDAGTDDPAPDPLPAGSFRIGRVAGCDVIVSRTWFVIAAVIAYLVAPQAELASPGLGGWSYLAGFGFAVFLYASVLLHEISHAVAARRFGFPVTSITLHFLGGMTAIRGESRRPREEFWIAVVGPLTSLAVGFAALWLSRSVDSGLAGLAVGGLAYANLFIGVLNLIPGLPLDGGRVLRAMIWGTTSDPHLATLIAGWLGRLLAIAALAWPYLQSRWLGVSATLGDYVMAVFVAGFLWMGASAAMSSARLRRRLPQLVGSRIARPLIAVPGDLSVAEALRRAEEAGSARIVTEDAHGSIRGIVSAAAVDATPVERRPWVPVASVARALEPGTVLPSTIAGEELIVAMNRRPADEYLLVDDDERAVGVLSTADVDNAFREGR